MTDASANAALVNEPPFDLVAGVDALEPRHGPLLAVVGVFDGLHQGHRWLLDALRSNAEQRGARPAVITFDSHPDEVLKGAAPPLLLDPIDRQRLLRDAGVSVVVVETFDAALRSTPYDVFVRRITDRTVFAGLLMTPDAAFGHERKGTPEALAELGRTSDPPFDVIVVPPFTLDDGPVSSSEIRRRVAEGDLASAAVMLGRPYGIAGRPAPPAETTGVVTVSFELPVALPPAGDYAVTVVDADVPGAAAPTTATVSHDPPTVSLAPAILPGAARLRVVFDGPTA